MEMFLWGAMASLILLAALLVISCRKLVHGAFALAVASAGVAVVVGMLGTGFLGAAHLLVLGAGVPSALLTAAAALNLEEPQGRRKSWGAASTGTILTGELILWTWHTQGEWSTGFAGGSARLLGAALCGSFLWPFGLLFFLFLLALAGSAALMRRGRKT